MAEREVHFVTSRVWDPASCLFGSTACDPPGSLFSGRVAVRAVADPMREGTAGTPALTDGVDADAGLVATLRSWLAAAARVDGIPLLYTHGFNYSFVDAVARTAAFCLWMEAGGSKPLVPLSFSWPSHGQGSLDAYRTDQASSASAGLALARLMAALAGQQTARKPVYLAHSMGVRATRCGMQQMEALMPGLIRPLFGQAFLMAGDDVADVLDGPRAGQPVDATRGGLRPIARLADHVTIGVNRDDGVVWFVSGTVNGGERLGTRGPQQMADLPGNVRVVDYSEVVGSAMGAQLPTAEAEINYIGHQYFRNNDRVRQDLVAALAADGPPERVPRRRWGHPGLYGISEYADRLYLDQDNAAA